MTICLVNCLNLGGGEEEQEEQEEEPKEEDEEVEEGCCDVLIVVFTLWTANCRCNELCLRDDNAAWPPNPFCWVVAAAVSKFSCLYTWLLDLCRDALLLLTLYNSKRCRC